MKRFFGKLSLVVLALSIATVAHAGLDDFLKRVNEKAIQDLSKFNVMVSAQFGIPVPQVDAVLRRVATPADAFMVFQLGQMTNAKPDAVLQIYQNNRNKGWGAIAKELGIKPGSSEFHALKRGDLAFTGEPGGGGDRGHGKGKGKGNKHK
jgi:hypothetical protein